MSMIKEWMMELENQHLAADIVIINSAKKYQWVLKLEDKFDEVRMYT